MPVISSCGPRFTDVRVIARSSDQTARELMEAFFIDKKGDMCVSDTSIVLYKSEKKFIEHALSRPHWWQYNFLRTRWGRHIFMWISANKLQLLVALRPVSFLVYVLLCALKINYERSPTCPTKSSPKPGKRRASLLPAQEKKRKEKNSADPTCRGSRCYAKHAAGRWLWRNFLLSETLQNEAKDLYKFYTHTYVLKSGICVI